MNKQSFIKSKQWFTLIEIMFVVGILVILIGIGWVAGAKILRKSAETQTRAEVAMLKKACESYKIRFGDYPISAGYDGPFNFVEHLSSVRNHLRNYSSDFRPMFVDFRKANMNLSSQYFNVFTDNSRYIGNITASDPYDQVYVIERIDDKIRVFSAGLDGLQGTKDDISTD